MEIIRASINDTDIFTKDELNFGACCFYTEDRKNKYFFEIKGFNATIFSNTCGFIDDVIDEFMFYSGFITTVKDSNGNILREKLNRKPFLLDISIIQPSQFFINKSKLENCLTWIKNLCNIFIPITIRENEYISLDGHTRIKAALELGYTHVNVYFDECNVYIFNFVEEAKKRNIFSVSQMELLDNEEYELRWNRYCDDFFASQYL